MLSTSSLSLSLSLYSSQLPPLLTSPSFPLTSFYSITPTCTAGTPQVSPRSTRPQRRRHGIVEIYIGEDGWTNFGFAGEASWVVYKTWRFVGRRSPPCSTVLQRLGSGAAQLWWW
ncbi:hypothetical protein Hanom_Chr07g00669251 [Helianthus anomalus]